MTKLFYYYLRDKNRQPFGCVCIGVDDDLKYTRGISLCSANDQFVKTVARKKSKSRCVHALVTKQNYYPINYRSRNLGHEFPESIFKLDTCKHLIPPPFIFTYKAAYDVNLTPFEHEMVKDELVSQRNCVNINGQK